jgi:hypothetical protein
MKSNGGLLYSVGNKKIGKDTVIINIHTATDCPAKDQCLLRNVCYAWSNERLRPSVIKYRIRQERLWEEKDDKFFINELKMIKSGQLKYIRFQEAGDFANQNDVRRMSNIAETLKGLYKCYTYTNRADLDFTDVTDNLVITGSYFMVDNMFVPLKTAAYNQIMDSNPSATHCPGDCRGCTLCKNGGGKVIYHKIH